MWDWYFPDRLSPRTKMKHGEWACLQRNCFMDQPTGLLLGENQRWTVPTNKVAWHNQAWWCMSTAAQYLSSSLWLVLKPIPLSWLVGDLQPVVIPFLWLHDASLLPVEVLTSWVFWASGSQMLAQLSWINATFCWGRRRDTDEEPVAYHALPSMAVSWQKSKLCVDSL